MLMIRAKRTISEVRYSDSEPMNDLQVPATHHAFFCCAVSGMRATINEVFLGIRAPSSVYTRNQRTDTTCNRNKTAISLLNILQFSSFLYNTIQVVTAVAMSIYLFKMHLQLQLLVHIIQHQITG
jgi:hypothetical protein